MQKVGLAKWISVLGLFLSLAAFAQGSAEVKKEIEKALEKGFPDESISVMGSLYYRYEKEFKELILGGIAKGKPGVDHLAPLRRLHLKDELIDYVFDADASATKLRTEILTLEGNGALALRRLVKESEVPSSRSRFSIEYDAHQILWAALDQAKGEARAEFLKTHGKVRLLKLVEQLKAEVADKKEAWAEAAMAKLAECEDFLSGRIPNYPHTREGMIKRFAELKKIRYAEPETEKSVKAMYEADPELLTDLVLKGDSSEGHGAGITYTIADHSLDYLKPLQHFKLTGKLVDYVFSADSGYTRQRTRILLDSKLVEPNEIMALLVKEADLALDDKNTYDGHRFSISTEAPLLLHTLLSAATEETREAWFKQYGKGRFVEMVAYLRKLEVKDRRQADDSLESTRSIYGENTDNFRQAQKYHAENLVRLNNAVALLDETDVLLGVKEPAAVTAKAATQPVPMPMPKDEGKPAPEVVGPMKEPLDQIQDLQASLKKQQEAVEQLYTQARKLKLSPTDLVAGLKKLDEQAADTRARIAALLKTLEQE